MQINLNSVFSNQLLLAIPLSTTSAQVTFDRKSQINYTKLWNCTKIEVRMTFTNHIKIDRWTLILYVQYTPIIKIK
jgi:hypothetical protein